MLHVIRLSLIFAILFFLVFPINSNDWRDLDEGEKKEVYGSEKSKKYAASNLFWEIERWDKHYGLRILYLYDHTDYPKYNSTQFFPFYYRQNSKIDNREKYRLFNYTYKREKTATDRSFLPYSSTNNPSLEKTNFIFFPMPFYYDFELNKKSSDKEITYGFLLFPFYYSNRTNQTLEKNRLEDKTHWTLFYYRSLIEEKNEFKESLQKSIWGFPVIPLLYYSSYNHQENYKRVLTLLHWENKPNETISAFSFLPFVMYKKNEYFRIPILLVDKDLSSPNPSYGKTFVPLLLYYNKWSPTSKTFLLGPWFQTGDSVSKESMNVFFPFYWSVKSERQDLSLIFPLYANYNDKENDYHINLLWITRSNTGLIHPSLSIEKKDNKWYLDTDFTFLYYLASFSFRQALVTPKFLRNIWNKKKELEEIENAKKELESTQDIPPIETDKKPKLTRKRSVSREESFNFSGYSLLFGILSYEAADSRRHFRLLPLSWFSWDKKSDDKVYVAPLFLWYEAEALEYLVLFPFYGKQREEFSEKKAFFINAYISENYKEANWKEHSVAWPIMNWYTSDTKSGHRVLPFYIHQVFNDKQIEVNQNYTLFSYYKNRTTKEYINTSFFIWPILSYYNSSTQFPSENNNIKESSKNYNVWITPFFHQSQSNYYKHTNLFWVLDWKYQRSKEEKLDRLIVFPFYYFSSGFIGIFPLSMNRTGNDFWTFTAFNYLEISQNYFYYNFLFLTELEKSPDYFEMNFLARTIHFKNTKSHFSSTGILGYGWNFQKENEIWKDASFLWLGYSKNREETIYNFLPVIRVADYKEEHSRIYGPLLLYTSEEKGKNFHLGLLGLGYFYNRNDHKNEEDFYVLLGSIYREYRGEERGFRAKGSLWGWLWEYQKEEETSFEKYSILKLFSYTKEADGTKKILGISL